MRIWSMLKTALYDSFHTFVVHRVRNLQHNFALIINIGAKKNHFCKKRRAGNCVDDISSIYLTLFWKYSGARKSGQKMIGQFFGKVLQSFARYRGNFCIILTTLLLDLKTSTQYSIW